MSQSPDDTQKPSAAATAPRRRLSGVDAARGIALFGMMTTHLIPLTAGAETTWALAFAGRASALFAVLAGVGISLSIPASALAEPHGWRRQAAGLATRSAIIVAIGLTLGAVDSGLAVILVHYGLLFLMAAAVLRLRTGWLATLALAWPVVMPALLHAARTWGGLPEFGYGSPSWTGLLQPGQTLSELLVTGYYPVLAWFGYLLVGMWLGRMDLRDKASCASIALLGLGTALAAKAASAALMLSGGYAALAAERPTSDSLRPFTLEYILTVSGYGTTPPGSWWWLAASGPHTGTPLDLLHTTGTAAATLGAACLLCAAVPRLEPALIPLSWPGSMPLTIYTGHVIAMIWRDAAPGGVLLTVHIAAAIAFALAWRIVGARYGVRRGPLEGLVAGAAGGARALV